MPIAGGLAHGLALSSFGTISRAMNWGLGIGKYAALRQAKKAYEGYLARKENAARRQGERA
jgi:hypothetical protein